VQDHEIIKAAREDAKAVNQDSGSLSEEDRQRLMQGLKPYEGIREEILDTA
jgi:hypothetical protein